MRYLKERIIRHLTEHPRALDMTEFMAPYSRLLCKHDLAGHILRAAGYHLQLHHSFNQPQLPLNAPWLDKKWIEFETQIGTCEGVIHIPALARQVWEEDYGEREAMELPFYDERIPGMPMLRFWDELGNVRADDVIEFLKDGGDGVWKLNGPDDREEE